MESRFAELAHFELDRAAMQRLSPPFCEQWHVVVLGDWPDDANSPITVGMPDPRDHRVVDLVAHMLMREISRSGSTSTRSTKPSISAFSVAHWGSRAQASPSR